MAIEVTCDSCYASYKVKNDRAGTRIRCKECDELIEVPDDGGEVESSGPALRRGGQSGGRKKKQESSNVGLFIGLGAAGFVGLIVLVMAARFLMKPGAPIVLPQQAGQLPAGNAPGVNAPLPGVAAPAPGSPAPVNPAQLNPAGGSPAPAVAAAAPLNWKVQPDPAEGEAADSALAKNVDIPMPAQSAMKWATFPRGSSRYVALGSNFRPNDVRQVWDLGANRQIGSVQTDIGAQRGELSADGQFFAAPAKTNDKVQIFGTSSGKQVGEVTVANSPAAEVRFAGPQRLVTLLFQKPLEVWSVPLGKHERSITVSQFFERESLATSPGGRYAALVEKIDNARQGVLRVYDLTSGELAGTAPLDEFSSRSSVNCKGLAFSPDGKELAGVLDSYGDEHKFHLVGWSTETGKVVFQHAFSEDVQRDASSAARDGAQVQWFPDQQRLFLYGTYVFDRKVGGPVWTLPEDESRSREAAAVFGNDRIIGIGGDRRQQRLVAAPLPIAELAKSAAALSSGGLAEDAGLPPLTNASREPSALNLSSPGSAWKVAVDPAPKPKKGKLLEKSIPLKAAANTIGSVLVAPVGRAVVALDQGPDKASFEVFSLADADKPESIETPFGCQALSLTTDGEQLLTRHTASPGRLDVWSVPKREHVVGWRPYQGAKKEDELVAAAAFVDAKHVLTLSGGHDLTLWEVPACRAVYGIKDWNPAGLDSSALINARYQEAMAKIEKRYKKDIGKAVAETVQPVLNPGLPAISPGGKYVVIPQSGQLVFINAVTGDVLGSVAAKGAVGAAAFNPEGTKYAATLKQPGGGTLLTVNLDDGNVDAEFPIPLAGTWLHWCGDTTLLLDNSHLLDTRHKMIVWKYQIPNAVHSPQSPDGRHWAVLQQTPGNAQRLGLGAVVIPEPTVEKRLTSGKFEPDLLLGPGLSVTLQMKVAPSPGDPQFEARTRTALTDQLTNAGISVEAGQPLTLIVSTNVKATGQTMSFRPIGLAAAGASPPPETTVPETIVECQISLQKGGQEVWSQKSNISNRTFGITRIGPGESIQDNLQKQLFAGVTDFFAKAELPHYVFADTAKNGAGSSVVTAVAAVPVKK